MSSFHDKDGWPETDQDDIADRCPVCGRVIVYEERVQTCKCRAYRYYRQRISWTKKDGVPDESE